jgi:DNA-binding response OmpR family regulator
MSAGGKDRGSGLADDQAAGYVYEFGSWLVEPHLNRIRKPGEEHQLEPRTIQVLTHLLDRAGEIVSVDELLDEVWADRVVEPNAVHRNLARIRRALGDPPTPSTSRRSPSGDTAPLRRSPRSKPPTTTASRRCSTACFCRETA